LKWGRMVPVLLGAGIGWGLVEPWHLRVRRATVKLKGLPEAAQGLRVVQISDLHAGAITPLPLLRRWVELANSLSPDLVVLTGDFVSRPDSYFTRTGWFGLVKPVDHYAPGLASELAHLRASLGVYAVPGNHDAAEQSFQYLADVLRAEAGIHALVNQSVKLANGLWLAGFDDLRGGDPDVRTALREVPREAAQLLLSHNPRLAWLVADRNALVLSGHTHGGQVRLPGNIFNKAPVDMVGSDWIRGFFQLERALLYVSPGVGSICVPLRLRMVPEVALFTLEAG